MKTDEEVTQRFASQVEHLSEGNGDWHENRKLIAYVMKEQGKYIDLLFDENRKLGSRLRSLEMRIASYIGGAVVIIWFIEKVGAVAFTGG